MKNLKNKFIIFMCSLLVFLTIPCSTVFAKDYYSNECVFVYVQGTSIYYWNGFNSSSLISSSPSSYEDSGYNSLFSKLSGLSSSSYVVFGVFNNADADVTEIALRWIDDVMNSRDFRFLNLIFDQIENQVNIYSFSDLENYFNSYLDSYFATPTYFPSVTITPSVIYQPVDAPIGDVNQYFSTTDDLGYQSNYGGSYFTNRASTSVFFDLYLNGSLYRSYKSTNYAVNLNGVSSLGVLPLYGASYYKHDGNVYVNFNDKKYQFTKWKFYLRNGVTPYNVYGFDSYIPVSTSLTGNFSLAPALSYYYYNNYGEKVVTSSYDYSDNYLARFKIDIVLVEVDGEIYNPPSNPPSSDKPFIDDDYKPLIPPNDPTLNNPSAPPLSNGSSSLSDNVSGEGFDLNHYLNFNFPVVLSYLGFLFTQCFNFMADNNIFFFSAVAVVVVAAIFIVIRERL